MRGGPVLVRVSRPASLLPSTKSTQPAEHLNVCVTADTQADLEMAMAQIHMLKVSWAQAFCRART